jgi:hypothetical protein
MKMATSPTTPKTAMMMMATVPPLIPPSSRPEVPTAAASFGDVRAPVSVLVATAAGVGGGSDCAAEDVTSTVPVVLPAAVVTITGCAVGDVAAACAGVVAVAVEDVLWVGFTVVLVKVKVVVLVLVVMVKVKVVVVEVVVVVVGIVAHVA